MGGGDTMRRAHLFAVGVWLGLILGVIVFLR
jgi:hypothetical protein